MLPSHTSPTALTALTPSLRAPPPAMYQSSGYPDYPFLPSSPPIQYYHQHQHHHHGGSHLYPPSPPQGASPSSDSGSFLSPPSSYAPSIPSSYLQRSSSALSLHKHVFDHARHHGSGGGGGNSNPHGLYDPPDLFDFQAAGPIRRVFSTGDIQGTNSTVQPFAAGENCSQEVGANGAAMAMQPGGRVGRYSAEERKERIERYRNKRSQRNFQKKITYACRKTLADSRPRIRGRFARNGETELEAEAEAGDAGYACSNSSPHGGAGADTCYGWAPAMVDDEEDYPCDPDFWANFFNNLSMNTLVPSGGDVYSNIVDQG